MRTLWMTMLAGVMAVSVGCGSDEEEALPEVDCSLPVPSYSEVTAFTTCTTCHSAAVMGAARAGAPVDDNFDTFEGAEAEATEIAEEVFEGKMPPPGIAPLSDDQKEQLYLWALCGAPE